MSLAKGKKTGRIMNIKIIWLHWEGGGVMGKNIKKKEKVKTAQKNWVLVHSKNVYIIIQYILYIHDPLSF